MIGLAKYTEIDIKAAVRKRDGFRCVDCGISQSRYKKSRGGQLDVHRLDPGSVYYMGGCITLCRTCHRKRHKEVGKEPVRFRLDSRRLHQARMMAAITGEGLPGIVDRALAKLMDSEFAACYELALSKLINPPPPAPDAE